MNFFNFYREEEYNLTAKDGVSLYCKVYIPKQSPSGKVMVIHHGFGEHLGRYFNLIETMEELKYTLYLFDARGHGKSGGKRGHVHNWQDFLSDLDLVIDSALKREKKERVVLFGHSMGAIITTLYAENEGNQKKLSSLVLSSLAIRPKLSFNMQVKRAIAPILSKLIPQLTTSAGISPELISHDQTIIEAYKKDKLVIHDISFYLGNFIINSEKKVLENAWQLKIPLYMFHGKNDGIANYEGSELFFELAASGNKKLILYPGLYHETLNEFPLNRQQVERDLVIWLKKNVPPRS